MDMCTNLFGKMDLIENYVLSQKYLCLVYNKFQDKFELSQLLLH